MKKKKILLIGWDAADWKVINPLMDQGLMPALESLVNNGTIGNLATLDPPLSPTLWTSISTGKRPYKHGVLGFTEADPTGSTVRPVHITSRKGRAIWNILSHKGFKCHQVGWWPSHPAEPINGTYISNFYQRANNPITEPWPMMEGTVHPKEKASIYEALRIHPQELTGAHILPFVPNGGILDQNDPGVQRRLGALTKIIADCSTIHAAATYILDNEEWDFMAVYYDAIDHFSHGFMKYHPPRRPHINPDDYEMYKNVITAAYRYHDMMLETLINSVPVDTTIMLISDHGFYPNHLRPKIIPREPAGPAYEHSPYGIIAAKGPDIKKDEIVYGASLLDITPTILAALDLPVGQDMDGKVLNSLFTQPKKLNAIPSWDEVEGNFYTHPEDFREDPEVSKEALQQLIDLGYIAAPGANEAENIKNTQRETNFYKARSYIDGGVYSEAVVLLEELHQDQPGKLHYSHRLAHCYLQLKKTGKARKVVQTIRSHQTKPSITLLVLQARVLIQEKNPEKAMTYVDEAIAIRDDFPGLQYYKGEIFMMLGNYDEAEKAYLHAIEFDPENRMAHHSLGKVYYHKGEYEKSAESILESLGLQFYAPHVHYDLGLTLEAMEDYPSAAEAYRNSLHMMKKNLKAKKRLFDLYTNKLNRPKRAAAIQASMPDYTLPEIIIVSGLPRSGTSMLMQMLQAGGIECFTDDIRPADENNQRGYFEHERIKFLPQDQSIIKQVGDKAVKIVAPLLFHLPKNYRYKIIFAERELGEVLLSQHKMLKRNKRKKQSEVFSFKLWQEYEAVINKVKETYKDQPNTEFLFLQHRDILEDPMSAAIEIAVFLDKDVDLNRMSQVVDKSLYREREKVSE